MKKRLLSLIMCVLMIASAFVMSSCAEEDKVDVLTGDIDDTKTVSNQTPMTISIYSIKEKGTTDEAIELVEKALSKIAIRRYNTTIDLILIEEEEYASQMFAKVRMAVNSYNTKRLNDKTLDKTQQDAIMKSNVDYQYTNEGNAKFDYYVKQSTNLPSEVLTGDLDIFLVYEPEAGIESLYRSDAPATAKKYSMFDILYNEQALAPLKTYLNNEYSEVKSVLYAHALEYVTRPGYKTSTQQEGQTMADDIFGIPNNYIYGNYEYVIFDTGYVNKIFDGENKQPYATSYEEEFKGKDNPTGKFAELVKELTEKQGTPGFEYDQVIKYFPDQQAYENYIASDETFAIGIVTGDKALEQLFEQHERLDVYVSKKNTVSYGSSVVAEDKDAYCDSMFCIGTPAMIDNGSRAKRCLQIMDLLSNNKEFRNIFQYGVEGTHYTKYSEEVIPLESPRLESKYYVDMRYTGNMFILYTSSDMDESLKLMSRNNWQLAKDQNVELVPKQQAG